VRVATSVVVLITSGLPNKIDKHCLTISLKIKDSLS